MKILAGVGRVQDAQALLDEILCHVREGGACSGLPELLRIKGELLMLCEAQARGTAESVLNESLASARHQGALSWELRAAMSLARLNQLQGQDVLAGRVLAPVYARFKGGFDTADLKLAGKMLAELGHRGLPRISSEAAPLLDLWS